MMNIKMAGKILDTLDTESAQVMVFPQVQSEGSSFPAIPLLDLYTEKRIVSGQQWPNMKPENLSDHSPLLFTWVLKKPTYYELLDEKHLPATVAVILSEDTAPENLVQMENFSQKRTIARFRKNSGVFRYQTFVSVLN